MLPGQRVTRRWWAAPSSSLVSPRRLPLEPDHTYERDVGEWVLVTAAAGGVGIAAVQLAKGMPPVHARNSPS